MAAMNYIFVSLVAALLTILLLGRLAYIGTHHSAPPEKVSAKFVSRFPKDPVSNAVVLALPHVLNRKNQSTSSRTCELRDSTTGQLRNFKVLIFVDMPYIDLFFNWLMHYREACGGELSSNQYLEVVCMGRQEGVQHLLTLYGLSCSDKSLSYSLSGYNTTEQKLSHVWMYRLQMVQQYLVDGVDIILTDSDAVWQGNPFVDLQPLSATAEIVASRGFYPWYLAEQWGACICMGFIYIKAGVFSVDVFSSINSNLIAQQHDALSQNRSFKADDQIAINEQLAEWKIQWPEGMIVGGDEHETGFLVRNQTRFNITMLAHDSYVRYCLPPATNWLLQTRAQSKTVGDKLNMAIIAHCNVAALHKKSFMRVHSIWKHNYTEFAGVSPERMMQARHSQLFKDLGTTDEDSWTNFTLNSADLYKKQVRKRKEVQAAALLKKQAEKNKFAESLRAGNLTYTYSYRKLSPFALDSFLSKIAFTSSKGEALKLESIDDLEASRFFNWYVKQSRSGGGSNSNSNSTQNSDTSAPTVSFANEDLISLLSLYGENRPTRRNKLGVMVPEYLASILDATQLAAALQDVKKPSGTAAAGEGRGGAGRKVGGGGGSGGGGGGGGGGVTSAIRGMGRETHGRPGGSGDDDADRNTTTDRNSSSAANRQSPKKLNSKRDMIKRQFMIEQQRKNKKLGIAPSQKL